MVPCRPDDVAGMSPYREPPAERSTSMCSDRLGEPGDGCLRGGHVRDRGADPDDYTRSPKPSMYGQQRAGPVDADRHDRRSGRIGQPRGARVERGDRAVPGSCPLRKHDDIAAGRYQCGRGREVGAAAAGPSYRKSGRKRRADGRAPSQRRWTTEPVVRGGGHRRTSPRRQDGEQRWGVRVRRVVCDDHARSSGQGTIRPASAGGPQRDRPEHAPSDGGDEPTQPPRRSRDEQRIASQPRCGARS